MARELRAAAGRAAMAAEGPPLGGQQWQRRGVAGGVSLAAATSAAGGASLATAGSAAGGVSLAAAAGSGAAGGPVEIDLVSSAYKRKSGGSSRTLVGSCRLLLPSCLA